MIFTIPTVAILLAGAAFLLFYSCEWTERLPFLHRILSRDPLMQSLVVEIVPAALCIAGSVAVIGGFANPWVIGALLALLSVLLFLKTLRCDLSGLADFAFCGIALFAGIMALNTLAATALMDCLL